jgi:hypothetical protein
MSLIKNPFSTHKRTVICPKCLNPITFDENTKDRLLQSVWKPLDSAEDGPPLEGGCPYHYIFEAEGRYRIIPCGYVFPLRYVENSGTSAPLFVQVFGWSGHGKTVFLDALRLCLMDMRTFWPQFVHQSITEEDMIYERTLRQFHMHGYMPEATTKLSRQQNKVYIMQLDHMVRWGSRSLVIMDHAGELFESLEVEFDEIPFLRDTPTALMLISIPQIINGGEGAAMDQLINIYIETMLRLLQQERRMKQKKAKDIQRELGIDEDVIRCSNLKDIQRSNLKDIQRKLVVVLTMADIIPRLPIHLRNYVVTDDTWERLRATGTHHMSDADMAEYVERMGWVSDEIREWLLRDSAGAPGGSNLVGLIEAHDFDARYCLISATGHDDLRQGRHQTDLENAGIQITPRRVLDPFYWALEFQST